MEQRIKDSFIVDTENGKVYWKSVSKFHQEKLGKEAGSPITSKFDTRWIIQLDGKKIKRSHVIYIFANGQPKGVIDHINRDSLDDRLENLRDVDVTTNNHNHSRRNIRKVKRTGKYQVRVGANFSKNVDTEEEAVNLYDKVRSELWQT